ncbi:MAG: hypothetical protein ACM3WT_08195 [Bacillota bacterium]
MSPLFVESLLYLMGVSRGDSVVDVGAGTGLPAPALARAVDPPEVLAPQVFEAGFVRVEVQDLGEGYVIVGWKPP